MKDILFVFAGSIHEKKWMNFRGATAILYLSLIRENENDWWIPCRELEGWGDTGGCLRLHGAVSEKDQVAATKEDSEDGAVTLTQAQLTKALEGDSSDVKDVVPYFGDAIFFDARTVLHEVLPMRKQSYADGPLRRRVALTFWLLAPPK